MASTYSHTGSLAGKTVVVTGSGTIVGLGRAVAQVVAERGGQVFLTDIDAEELAQTTSELRAKGHVVESLVADITDRDQAAAVIDAAIAAFGHLDGLVNNATARQSPTPFTELSDAAYDAVFEVGPRATFRLMQHAYPHLKARGGGSVVNFGSGAGAAGAALFGAYAGAKEAIRGISKAAAFEWAKDNIRVNNIVPIALTGSQLWWRDEHPEEAAAATAGIPLGRMGDALTDVAPVIAFLLGDDATYLTGQTIFVDGGSSSIR